MLIGVLSDTHLDLHDARVEAFLAVCNRHFHNVEVILHAGDIVDPRLLALLPCPVLAVRGNLDPPELPLKRIVSLGGKRIAVMHGWGPASGIEARIIREFADEQVDCIVYGHTHMPVCHRVNNMLLFNPGSCMDRRNAPFPSLGKLEIGREIIGQIIALQGENR